MKKAFLTGTIAIISVFAFAQPALTIDSCYARARQNYPLVKQKELIEKTKDYNVSNAAKGYLPQVNFSGQTTYQSTVTTIPSLNIPGFNFNIPTVSKTQFNVHGEIDQTVYDGGVIKQQQNLQTANAGTQEQNVETQLYTLKDRVNQLYFGTLLISEQLKQNKLVQQDIQNSIERMQSSVNNGVVLGSTLNELQAELLQQQQNEVGLKASRKAYLDMLGLFINMPLDENTVLESPRPVTVSDNVNRPELLTFDFQKRSDDVQLKLLKASLRPKLVFFFQGGYALPGLNGFNPDPDWYYITGFRLNWSIGGFYTLKNQKQMFNIDKQMIDIQRENFLFNTHLQLKQQNADIVKLQQMINMDNEIISKRTAVKNAAKSQLDNGVITAHDYIGQLNAEDLAKQNLLLHQVQLLVAQYNYQNTTGN
jgi:outer membrane protein TolC